MPAPVTEADFDKAWAELEGENDRAAILVGGSLLEYALELGILSRLREPQDPAEEGVLFSDKGILETFSQKIWGAYFLKVIGPQVRRDIDLIRKIRNFAAHDLSPISFSDTPQIASRCRELIFPRDTVPARDTPQNLRGMFLVTIQFFTANLLLRSGDSDAKIAEAFKGLAPYLDA